MNGCEEMLFGIKHRESLEMIFLMTHFNLIKNIGASNIMHIYFETSI